MGAIRALATALVVAAAVFVPTLGSEPEPEVVTEVLSAGTTAPEPDSTPATAVEVGAAPEPAAPTSGISELEALVYQRAVEVRRSSPGVAVSVTVSHAGEVVSVSGTVPFDPAGAAKLYWLVAAVDAVGADAVEPYAEVTFADDDATATSGVIDLVGVDAINDFTAAAGLDDTYLSLWIDGGIRRTGAEAAEREFRNTTTTGDAVSFLDRLAGFDLLDLTETARVTAWMTFAPDFLGGPGEWGGVLTDRLPPEVAALTMHKAGWLPPGCCLAVENGLTAMGLVPLPDGSRFTIAVAAFDGADYDAQAAWISQLTADVYELLATGGDG